MNPSISNGSNESNWTTASPDPEPLLNDELEDKLRQYKQHARNKLREYKEKARDDLDSKQLELDQAYDDLHQTTSELWDTQELLVQAQSRNVTLQDTVDATFRDREEDIKKEMADHKIIVAERAKIQRDNDQLSRACQWRTAELARVRNELDVANRQIDSLKRQLVSSKHSRFLLKEQLGTEQQTRTELAEKAADLAKTSTALRQARDALSKTKNELSEMKDVLGKTKLELKEAKDAHSNTKHEMWRKDSELSKTKGELSKTKDVLFKTKTELASMKTELESTKTELGSMKTEFENMKTELGSAKTELEKTKTELEGLKSESELMKGPNSRNKIGKQDLTTMKEKRKIFCDRFSERVRNIGLKTRNYESNAEKKIGNSEKNIGKLQLTPPRFIPPSRFAAGTMSIPSVFNENGIATFFTTRTAGDTTVCENTVPAHGFAPENRGPGVNSNPQVVNSNPQVENSNPQVEIFRIDTPPPSSASEMHGCTPPPVSFGCDDFHFQNEHFRNAHEFSNRNEPFTDDRRNSALKAALDEEDWWMNETDTVDAIRNGAVSGIRNGAVNFSDVTESGSGPGTLPEKNGTLMKSQSQKKTMKRKMGKKSLSSTLVGGGVGSGLRDRLGQNRKSHNSSQDTFSPTAPWNFY